MTETRANSFFRLEPQGQGQHAATQAAPKTCPASQAYDCVKALIVYKAKVQDKAGLGTSGRAIYA